MSTSLQGYTRTACLSMRRRYVSEPSMGLPFSSSLHYPYRPDGQGPDDNVLAHKSSRQASTSTYGYPPLAFWPFLQSHPFVVTNLANGKQSTLELFIQPRRGLTRELFSHGMLDKRRGVVPNIAKSRNIASVNISILKDGVDARRSQWIPCEGSLMPSTEG